MWNYRLLWKSAQDFGSLEYCTSTAAVKTSEVYSVYFRNVYRELPERAVCSRLRVPF